MFSNAASVNSGSLWTERLKQDFQFAVRQLHRSPGFAITVALTLSLCIGANLAVIRLVNGVLFSQLAVSRPSELFSLHAVKSPFDKQWIYSFAAFENLRKSTEGLAPVSARSGVSRGIVQGEQGFTKTATYQLVSGNFFDVLGVGPYAGRVFSPSDEISGSTEVPVILRYAFALEQFRSAEAAVGKKVSLNGIPVLVIGVAPERFTGVIQGVAPDFWLPLSAQALGHFPTWFDSLGRGHEADLSAPYRDQHGIFWLWVLARIPDGAKVEAKRRWTEALQPDLRFIADATRNSTSRETMLHSQIQLVSAAGGEGSFSSEYGRPLLLLIGMATVVFFVGCFNLANLQIARLFGRRQELALRVALGATRRGLLQQLLIEDALLVVIGGTIASIVSGFLSALLVKWASGRNHDLAINLHLGLSAIVVGLALMLLSLVAFSAIPALYATRQNLRAAMQVGVGKIAAQGRRGRQVSNALLSGQVGLSLVLLSMATLFAETLDNLNHIDAGLDRGHLLSVHFDLAARQVTKEYLTGTNRLILDSLKSLPNVKDAAMQMCEIPNCTWNTEIHVSGHPELPDDQIHGEENHVSAGYFRTLGIPLLRGREFNETDQRQTQRVAILNEAFAKKLFGEDDPVGHYVGPRPAPGDHTYLVVGEVGNSRVDGLRSPTPPIAYFSLEQGADQASTIEVRAIGPPSRLIASVRQRLYSLDSTLPISEIVALDTEFEDGLSTEKMVAKLTAAFGGLTLLLGIVGFYGLMSFNVSRRASEIGVRIAIGATRAQIQLLFIKQALIILTAGIIPGIVIAQLARHAAGTLLYGVNSNDFWAVFLAICLLAMSGIAATVIPAKRAASLDPLQSLRAE
jgi:predicted permease